MTAHPRHSDRSAERMNTITITKRYHRPSTSSEVAHSRVMGIRLSAPPFEIPPDRPEMTRAARCAVTQPARITGAVCHAIMMAALREVAAESNTEMED